MLTVDLNAVELADRGPGLRAAFPISSALGTTALAVVWIELGPDGMLHEHTDSAEELLFVVEGEVEAWVGSERGTLSAGEAVVVPALEPHGLRNASDAPVRVLGVFAGSTNVAVFTEPHGPNGEQVFVIGAPAPMMSTLEEAVAVV